MEGGIFKNAGLSTRVRVTLFYSICIWVRLSIAFAVMFAAQAWYTGTLVIVLSASVMFAVGELAQNSLVWWNRKVHALTGFAVALSAIVGLITENDVPVYAISVLLMADVVWGALHAAFVYGGFASKR